MMDITTIIHNCHMLRELKVLKIKYLVDYWAVWEEHSTMLEKFPQGMCV